MMYTFLESISLNGRISKDAKRPDTKKDKGTVANVVLGKFKVSWR